MTTVDALLVDLAHSHIKVWAEGDTLHCNAPKGAMTPDLRARLQAYKPALLTLLGGGQHESDHEPIPVASRALPVPLSFGQQRLWFLHQLNEDGANYNLPLALRLRGPLNRKALEGTLQEVARRHEIFRTTFPLHQGEPIQQIASTPMLPLAVTSLVHLPAAERDQWVAQMMRAEVAAPFDLAKGPLTRLHLLVLNGEDHILFATMHHIIFDGWSMGVLMQELATVYAARVGGYTPHLPALRIQYADFAHWQRQRLTGATLDRELAYWHDHLAGAPMVLNLPTDHPRPAQQTFAGGNVPVQLSAALTEALGEVSRREGATLFMTLLAAWGVLLYRYSQQRDVVIGTPIANRTHRDLEPLVGFFVNTLALRLRFDPHMTFTELLSHVQEVSLGGYAHQDIPLEKLVEVLQPERDLSRPPLFQVMFALQNAPNPPAQLAGLSLERLELPGDTAKFDLTLLLQERDGGIVGKMEYNRDLYAAPTIERMVAHFRRLLGGIVATPDAPLLDLPLLSFEERKHLVVTLNDTAAPFPITATIHGLLEEQAATTPHAIAVRWQGTSLTYADLNARANRIAAHLRAQCVGVEARVGVCLARTPHMVIALLAILKVGAAYVPLDPAYPTERIAYMLEDSQVALVMAGREQIALIDAADCPVVDIATWLDTPIATPATPRTLDSRQLAYLIYTSGSTGKPKGVAITHRNAVALFSWAATVYSRTELSGVLAATSICFDLSVYELFLPLSIGGTVILADNALALVDLPERDAITLINTVPSAIIELLRLHAIPPSAATINLAGEPLATHVVDQLYALGTVAKVYDLYGPSEDTTYSTFALRQAGARATIGRPLANSQLYVLDTRLNPVPQGVVGELYIGGEGVSRGYLNRPTLTAERYIPDPFGGTAGARLYKTGDLVRYMPNGNVEFLGRNDHQVKIRGFRIELGEIEARLSQHLAVERALVVARPDVHGQPRLLAYLTLKTDASDVDWRGWIRVTLPEYMVPSAFIVLDEFPLTPNGKIERSRLPDPDMADLPTVAFVAPRDAIEEAVAKVWCGVLGVTRLSIHDNFFERGGHSLAAVRMRTVLHEQYGYNAPLGWLFQYPTLAQFSDAVRRQVGGNETPHNDPVVPLQVRNGQPSFFWIHPIGGTVFAYRELAQVLGAAWSIYGVQSPYLTGGIPDDLSVEGLADLYLNAIRVRQPHGPYALGGWSFGGVVALEIAHRLREMGETVVPLVLLDSYHPSTMLPFAEGSEAQALAAFHRDYAAQGQTDDPAQVNVLYTLFREHHRAVRAYTPPAYPDPVLLVLAQGRERHGWSTAAYPALTTLALPADHYTLLRPPHIGQIAAALRQGTVL